MVKIKGIEYNAKQSLRSLMLFEQITGKKAGEIEDNLTDTLTIYYCMLKANNKDFNYTFDAFIDEIEIDETILQQLLDILKVNTINNVDKQQVKKKKI